MSETKRKKVGELLVFLGHITLEQLSVGLEKHHETGETLGSIFIKLGFINEQTLYEVLSHQIESEHRRKVGEILVSYGYITQEQLEKALAEQQNTRKRLGEILEAFGLIDEEKIIDVLSAQLDISHVVLEGYPFQKEVVALLPQDMALHYKMIPLFRQRNILTLATADPTNLRNLDHVKFKTGLEIEPMLASEKSILDAIRQCYVQTPPSDVKTKVPPKEPVVVKKQEDEADGEKVKPEERVQIRTIINQLIGKAVVDQVSDIHLEPGDDAVRVRTRIRGELKESKPLEISLYPQIISRLKAMAGIQISDKKLPQKGRFRIRTQGKDYSLRISTFPCLNRTHQTVENITVRIQDSQPGDLELEKLGMNPPTLELIKKTILRPGGIFLSAGPEMSGKTTTLYSILRYLNKPDVNIYTLEETIETHLEGIHQSQIRPREGFDFADGLKWILLQDPDVVMLGELQDAKTFEMAVRAAQSGVRIFASIKADDFYHVLSKLFSLGIDPALISSGLSGVLTQRLVRKICTYCREAYEPSMDVLHHLQVPAQTTLFLGKGCDACGQSGYNGKVGIFEMTVINQKIRLMLLGNKSLEEIKKSVDQKSSGSLYKDGIQKCSEGITSLEQVLSVSSTLYSA
jgi:type IV pilus assembly protein PilB